MSLRQKHSANKENANEQMASFGNDGWYDTDDEPENQSNEVVDDEEEDDTGVIVTKEQIEELVFSEILFNSEIMGLHDDIVKALTIHGYDSPTAPQKLVAYLKKVRGNIVVGAQTGTGKTMTAGLIAADKVVNNHEQIENDDGSIVQGVDHRDASCAMSVILCNTRLMVVQMFNQLEPIFTDAGITLGAFRGTQSKKGDEREMESAETIASNYFSNFPQLVSKGKIPREKAIPGNELVIITTCGKFVHLTGPTVTPKVPAHLSSTMKRSNGNIVSKKFMLREPIDVSNIATVIVDEADQFVAEDNKKRSNDANPGFQQFMDRMKSTIVSDGKEYELEPESVIFMSATIAGSSSFLFAAKRMGYAIPQNKIFVVPSMITRCEHYYHVCNDEKNKMEILSTLLRTPSINNALIFCKDTITCQHVHNILERAGYPVGMETSDTTTAMKDEIVGKFMNGQLKYLLSAGGLGRGFDLNTLQYVINYDCPSTGEKYVHQAGRAARMLRSGACFTLVAQPNSRANCVPPSIASFQLKIKKQFKLLSEYMNKQGR